VEEEASANSSITTEDGTPETSSSMGGAMVKHRPGRPMAAALARARFMGTLFGDAGIVGGFGRFRVIGRLGGGGMGVVYEAYDPDLARGVALKLVEVTDKDRGTALAEAKALARLSHPNVVPIYDVGLEREGVYLVMELVRGQTLRAWAPGRSLREILEVYQQAGRALAAAHAAGLVHRDFKPENALIGGDQRVRVVDFGLACEADDPARATHEQRAIAGTPRFMAPEAKTGAAITPAADQYSFCVALAEALDGAREPAPRWITAVLDRGRAADPAQRFPAMVDLQRALARDPARTRRRAAAIVGLVSAASLLAFLVGRQHTNQEDPCADGAARLAKVWDHPARTASLARISALGPYGASLQPTLARELNDHAAQWVREYRAACVDHLRGTETTTLSDRRTTCLEDGRRAFAEVRALVTNAGPATLVQLPRAVQSLPDPAACSDLAALASDVEPPPPAFAQLLASVREQVVQARIQVGAGSYESAAVRARAAVAAARVLGYRPLLAEALLVQGHAQLQLAPIESVPVLTEAMSVANQARDRTVAIEAWARRAYALAVTRNPAAAAAEADFVLSEAKGSAPGSFALALLYNNLGSVALAGEHRTEARDYFTHAVAVSRNLTGAGALELVVTRANLAIVTDDRAAADQLVARAAADRAQRLGADHPDTLDTLFQRAVTTVEDLHTTAEMLIPICAGYDRHSSYRSEDCWLELGLVRADLGDRAGAIDAMTRASHTPGNPVLAVAYLAFWEGDVQASTARFAAAIDKLPGVPSEPWWKTLERAELTLGLGQARRAQADLPEARTLLTRTVADLAMITRTHPATSFERRLGRAQVELALTLAAIGAAKAEKTAIAAAGLSWLRRAGARPAEISQLVTEADSTR